MRNETYQDGALIESVVIERVAQDVTYTREDGEGAVLESRDATADEVAALVAKEDRTARFASRQKVAAMVGTLQGWATDAEAVTVTSGNAVATLQTLNNRFGKVADGLADLLIALSMEAN